MGFLPSDEITFCCRGVFCKTSKKHSYPDSGSGIHLNLVNIRQLEYVQTIDRNAQNTAFFLEVNYKTRVNLYGSCVLLAWKFLLFINYEMLCTISTFKSSATKLVASVWSVTCHTSLQILLYKVFV